MKPKCRPFIAFFSRTPFLFVRIILNLLALTLFVRVWFSNIDVVYGHVNELQPLSYKFLMKEWEIGNSFHTNKDSWKYFINIIWLNAIQYFWHSCIRKTWCIQISHNFNALEYELSFFSIQASSKRFMFDY